MKSLIFAGFLALSSSAFAGMVWPQVSNWGSSVEVSIWNHTDEDVRCSGSVYFSTSEGRSESHYYMSTVYKRSSDYERYYLFTTTATERITSVNHTISCF